MKKTFLRGDKLESYLPLGENGQAVHLSALQLRETLRLRQLSDVANSLAIPQGNEQGDRIDWYAGFSGNVVPWSAATYDERQSALRQLEAHQAAIEQLSAQMIQQKAPEMRLFGALLSKTIQFPDQDHIYLVDGKPVVTFWGFVNAKQQARPNPLECLEVVHSVMPSVASVAPTEPTAETLVATPPPVSERSRRWLLPRWLWCLLPLLLILFALLLLRGCVPDVYIWGMTPSTHSTPPLQGEIISKEGKPVPEQSVPALSVSESHSLPLVKGVSSVNGTASVNSTVPVNGAMPIDGASSSVDGTSPVSPDVNPIEPMIPTQPIPPAEALTIPDIAVRQGTTDFLNGSWHAGAGIQDSRTGKPLSLTYQMADGKGQVEMARGDGVRCQAPVKAAMNSGALQLDNIGEAKCSDGSVYTMPEVVCQSGSEGTAECQGRYDEKTLFPMSMKREAN
ncbi:putative virulence effector protein, SfrA [Xenorhabdus bovienii str. oregonense]|uniref:Putative virulence effector protein, SfrA n=1 Tax=Xenorhabdus bovienii str. oregonense TaxID=1398202 RepID=A0A077NZQ0_XENBV|nr:SrfA family protein [Xenorhabdus bovienii]CDH04260.1 putative virulence effector protein, SfrA [Xenorhabdus bovienii str. oregonense]